MAELVTKMNMETFELETTYNGYVNFATWRAVAMFQNIPGLYHYATENNDYGYEELQDMLSEYLYEDEHGDAYSENIYWNEVIEAIKE